MKKQFLIIFVLIFFIKNLSAQSYRRDTSANQYSIIDTGYLNLFTINDTLKYFEFYTRLMIHEDLESGILSKISKNVYSLKYASGNNFAKFNLYIEDSTIKIKYVGDGGKAYSLNGTFILNENNPKQIAYTFPLNYKVLYKAIKDVTIKAYEYPNCNANYKIIYFKKGEVIEETWKVGIFPETKSMMPIKTNSWRLCIYHVKNHDWILISDISEYFELIKIKGHSHYSNKKSTLLKQINSYLTNIKCASLKVK